jgi:hypothetical protein
MKQESIEILSDQIATLEKYTLYHGLRPLYAHTETWLPLEQPRKRASARVIVETDNVI